MKILVSMGSFKDVFNPIEVTSIVSNALNKHNVLQAPMCDGGEYTFDVLKYHKKCKEITVDNVVNPYGKEVSSHYLVIDDIAYIVSSEIIKLSPDEEEYKNPLILTDYGLGQLCLDAINRGYKKINLCLGGTSTVSFGMGFAQAMGAKFFSHNGTLIDEPVTTSMIENVARIEEKQLDEIRLIVINDGVTTAHDLTGINPQKIGYLYSDIKDSILMKLDESLKRVCMLTNVSINTPFAGNAGGVRFGIEMISQGDYLKGTDFFMDLFGVKNTIRETDLVITGEGRLDNPHTEKLPVSISMIAEKYNKECLYICGQKDEKLTGFKAMQYGIKDIICCKDYYCEVDNSFEDSIECYKKLAPIIIKRELRKRYG